MLGNAEPRDRSPERVSAEREGADALRATRAGEHAYPLDRFEGRGLIVCAGGARMFTCAWVLLCLLRRILGCHLPIEVWHLGEEEIGPIESGLLAELDVETVDALEVRKQFPARVLGGWELKAYALVQCRFQEVLLLDADNVPVRDPSFLFDSPQYADNGALFWPDVVQIGADNPVWELCELPYRSEPAWESGQVVIDKARCWHPLNVALCMNEYSDVFYRHLLGDKDTYHLAWRMLEQPIAMPRRPRVMPYGLLQHDFNGEPLFQHRSQVKWVLRGENLIDPSFRHEDACLEFLAELQGRWSGRIESLPEREGADLETEGALAAARLFRFERVGSDAVMLELLPGNRVGEGRIGAMLRWYVLDGELVLEGLTGPSFRLRPCDEGDWRGLSQQAGRHEVRLRALTKDEQDPIAGVVAAVLVAVADGRVEVDDAVTTLLTLGRVASLGEVLARERTRAAEGSQAALVLDQARWRLGRRNPSLRPLEAIHRRHYEPS